MAAFRVAAELFVIWIFKFNFTLFEFQFHHFLPVLLLKRCNLLAWSRWSRKNSMFFLLSPGCFDFSSGIGLCRGECRKEGDHRPALLAIGEMRVSCATVAGRKEVTRGTRGTRATHPRIHCCCRQWHPSYHYHHQLLGAAGHSWNYDMSRLFLE